MAAAVWWFGLAHLVIYGAAGCLFVFGLVLDWVIGRQKLTRDVVNAYLSILRERRGPPA